MTSWTKDEDRYRLPEGVVRIGYDADSQRYQFRDRTDGSFWEGPEGAKYGKLRRVSTTGHERMFASPDSSPTSPRPTPRSPAQRSPSSSNPATDFTQILGSIKRDRAVSDASAMSSRPRSTSAQMGEDATKLLGAAMKRSATVTSKLSRSLSRRAKAALADYEPLLEEKRSERYQRYERYDKDMKI